MKEFTLALDDFVPYYAATQDGQVLDGEAPFPVSWGNAIFIRRTYPVHSFGATFVHRTRSANQPREVHNQPTALQYVKFEIGNTLFTIYNFHGVVPAEPIIPNHPDGKDPKIDYPDRITQAQRIRALLNTNPGAKLLCGDFNLRPDTESMRIVAGTDLENIVATRGIADTRGPLHEKPIRVVDHMLVSSEIRVQDLRVPSLAISDHLPLILTFSLK